MTETSSTMTITPEQYAQIAADIEARLAPGPAVPTAPEELLIAPTAAATAPRPLCGPGQNSISGCERAERYLHLVGVTAGQRQASCCDSRWQETISILLILDSIG